MSFQAVNRAHPRVCLMSDAMSSGNMRAVASPDVTLQFDDASSRRIEAVYQAPDIVAQRARVLELLALEPGERVADLGCGPALLAVDMARQVGHSGTVDGLDASPSMIALGRRRVAAFPRVRLCAGGVTDLPYADRAFDVAVCTQVYEFVADIEGALRELKRVIRPGGRALIMDTDWESCVWRSSDDARMRRLLDCWDTHCPHPHLPRRLVPLLREAGFSRVETHVIPIVSADFREDSYSAGAIELIAGHARASLDETTVNAWVQDLRALADRGEWFFSLNRYVFLATA